MKGVRNSKHTLIKENVSINDVSSVMDGYFVLVLEIANFMDKREMRVGLNFMYTASLWTRGFLVHFSDQPSSHVIL